AVQLGLDAEQVIVPLDHVLVPEAALLPAIAVVRLPSGVTHFAVVWRRHGPFVQLMDPASGRRWPPAGGFSTRCTFTRRRSPQATGGSGRQRTIRSRSCGAASL